MEIINSIISCDHREEIEAIKRGQELLSKLQAMVLPFIDPLDQQSLFIFRLFQEIRTCSIRAVSVLQSGCMKHHESLVYGEMNNKRSREEKKILEEEAKNISHNKRRRYPASKAHVTTVPHYDGYQWIKYGQKPIFGAKHPRSYYRCTYYKEQRCLATKTVQQEDYYSDPPKFAVVNIGNHTCNIKSINLLPCIIESNPEPFNSKNMNEIYSPKSVLTRISSPSMFADTTIDDMWDLPSLMDI